MILPEPMIPESSSAQKRFSNRSAVLRKADGCRQIIVIDTESRTVHPDHAYEIVSHALEDVDFDSFRYVIKKVDSTMRGNIAAEIKAVDEHFKPELMIFAPAPRERL